MGTYFIGWSTVLYPVTGTVTGTGTGNEKEGIHHNVSICAYTCNTHNIFNTLFSIVIIISSMHHTDKYACGSWQTVSSINQSIEVQKLIQLATMQLLQSPIKNTFHMEWWMIWVESGVRGWLDSTHICTIGPNIWTYEWTPLRICHDPLCTQWSASGFVTIAEPLAHRCVLHSS